MDKGSLEVRNSETLELKFFRLEPKTMQIEPVSVQINALASLRDLSEAI